AEPLLRTLPLRAATPDRLAGSRAPLRDAAATLPAPHPSISGPPPPPAPGSSPDAVPAPPRSHRCPPPDRGHTAALFRVVGSASVRPLAPAPLGSCRRAKSARRGRPLD